MKKIVSRIGRGKVEHAAEYDEETGAIEFYCKSLNYENYFAAIVDYTEPTPQNVTCKKCLKEMGLKNARKYSNPL